MVATVLRVILTAGEGRRAGQPRVRSIQYLRIGTVAGPALRTSSSTPPHLVITRADASLPSSHTSSARFRPSWRSRSRERVRMAVASPRSEERRVGKECGSREEGEGRKRKKAHVREAR